MKIYKLTTLKNTTHQGFQWEPGKWVETSGKGDLCGPGWLHAYTHPLLAILLNPIHADIPEDNLKLWEAEGDGEVKKDHGLTVGYTKMRLVQEMPIPAITLEMRIRFAIFCALEVYHEPSFEKWAHAWLDGSDRSADSAVWAASAAMAAWADSLDLIALAEKACNLPTV